MTFSLPSKVDWLHFLLVSSLYVFFYTLLVLTYPGYGPERVGIAAIGVVGMCLATAYISSVILEGWENE